MSKKDFYQQQDNLTASKIETYKRYIEVYLFKLLIGYGKCFIADLFCGPGNNGDKLGSPLVLIDRIKYVFTSERLKNKNPKVFVLFNDENKDYVKTLAIEIEKTEIPANIKIFYPKNKEFKEILVEIKEQLKSHGKELPKFFFLDPFSYSVIKMQDLRDLMELQCSEVLMFLPIFHSYRFASCEDFKDDHKTKRFLEEFTTEGVSDYKNIYDFSQSIKDKVKNELGLEYVRSVLLDAGSRKNALLLITRNRTGMLLMNKIIFKSSEDGVCIKIGKEKCKTLFGIEETPDFKRFNKHLNKIFSEKKILSNHEIIDLTISEGFLPSHVLKILKKLKNEKLISIIDAENKKTSQFYIAEKPKATSFFHYLG